MPTAGAALRSPREVPLDKGQRQLLVRALEAAANAVFVAKRDGTIVWVNDAFCRQSGYSRDHAIGRTPHLLKSGKQPRTFYCGLWETILSGRAWRGELVERHRDGSHYTVSEVITPLLDSKGHVTHFIATLDDVSSAAKQYARIQRLAYHDALTRLPNRKLFLERLRLAIRGARARRGMLAVMFLDLDRFKRVNDNFGHTLGDRLLKAVAERLRAAVRKGDPVARLSGDEFTILLENLQGPAVASALAKKLGALMTQPFSIDGRRLIIGASVGISLYPKDGKSANALLARADAAMYRAKGSRRQGYPQNPEV
jgi:diguanylate cyclase